MSKRNDDDTRVVNSLENSLKLLGFSPENLEDSNYHFDYTGYGPELAHAKYGKGCFTLCLTWCKDMRVYYGNLYFLTENGDRPYEFSTKERGELEKVITSINVERVRAQL